MSDMKISVAFYLRTGNTEQDMSQQLSELEAFAVEHHLEAVKIYADEGFSGNSSSRPSLDQLLAVSKSGLFEQVIVTTPDRIGRNPVAYFHLEAKLAQYGVQLRHSRSLTSMDEFTHNISSSVCSLVYDYFRDEKGIDLLNE